MPKKPVREDFAGGLLYRDRRRQIWLSGKGMLAVIASTILIALPFFHFGRSELVRPAIVSIGVMVYSVAMGWGLKRRVWFWVTLAFLLAVHVAVILVVPWTTDWVPAAALVPVALADLYAMYWVFSVVGKFEEGPQISEELKRPDKL